MLDCKKEQDVIAMKKKLIAKDFENSKQILLRLFEKYEKNKYSIDKPKITLGC